MSDLQPTLAQIAEPGNLLAAFSRARCGKRHRAEVAVFELALETEIFRLRDELLAGRWRPGAYRTFRVRDPVERVISAAPFRDRVVHQALCHCLEPLFESEFLPCSYACRRGKGTHRALRAASYWARRVPYVLHADVAKFFASIDHDVLKRMLARRLRDDEVLALCGTIIDAAPPQELVLNYFPGDHLFSPLERRRGLPIGNLTSQWFANLVLHDLDVLVSRGLGEDSYVRYMDDMLLFGYNKERLCERLGRMSDCLAGLRLRLNERKTVIAPVVSGFAFLGFRIFPSHRLLLARSARRARRRLKRLRHRQLEGRIAPRDFELSLQAWVAHARHGDTWRLRATMLRDLGLSRTAGPGP